MAFVSNHPQLTSLQGNCIKTNLSLFQQAYSRVKVVYKADVNSGFYGITYKLCTWETSFSWEGNGGRNFVILLNPRLSRLLWGGQCPQRGEFQDR